ncbi:MAG: MOSC domain-containing protein [Nitriliruptorales bacterium]|nr:MOSC domain-containing protein [Nitriliruptorales bacterium]
MSWEGTLAGIYLSPAAAAGMRAVPEVEAAAGYGLAGDRYAAEAGTWSRPDRPWGQVTLIESETVTALARDHDVDVGNGLHRRNLVTAGVPLNHLVGETFLIDGVLLRGSRLCEPCGHLDELSGERLSRYLTHRGGLNAEILSGGRIAVGARIRPAA